eukprot:scaffold82728_cov17-Tisochrysis_lutea.AAC.1
MSTCLHLPMLYLASCRDRVTLHAGAGHLLKACFALASRCWSLTPCALCQLRKMRRMETFSFEQAVISEILVICTPGGDQSVCKKQEEGRVICLACSFCDEIHQFCSREVWFVI